MARKPRPTANPDIQVLTDPQSEAHLKAAALKRLVESGKIASFEPLLPFLLRLKGNPYSLESHFPFGPMFRFRQPRNLVIKSGRQVSKSTSIASAGVLQANSLPHFSTLYITPLFEQIRRFSANYVRPFIDTSPIKPLWSDSTTENSVLQRTFKNGSKMIFSFAFLNADRIRGISADALRIDEVQDMNLDHIDVIKETLSHSLYNLTSMTGTPKSIDGPLEAVWGRSSQAEWFVPCYACGHQNIPTVEYDLDAMIGPYRDDISEERPGTVCAKCRKPINPRFGRWVHRFPDRRWDWAGYHVPQLIMPLHFSRASKWKELTEKRQYMPTNEFHNEVLGESYDTGSKLITLTELKQAATLPWENNPNEPRPEVFGRLDEFAFRVLGIDWGGGGKEGVSFTTLALIGFRSDGRLECIWGKRLLSPHDHMAEAEEIRQWITRLRPHVVAHDYTGAGALRETVLIQAGVDVGRIMACSYVRSASSAICKFNPATESHPRAHYSLDKTRSLLYTATAIKLGLLSFFQYDFKSEKQPGLLHDFLALIDEKVETASTAGIYVIKRTPNMSDDFAHAVNLGCVACWHAQQAWPDFAARIGHARITAAQLAAAMGPLGAVNEEAAMTPLEVALHPGL